LHFAARLCRYVQVHASNKVRIKRCIVCRAICSALHPRRRWRCTHVERNRCNPSTCLSCPVCPWRCKGLRQPFWRATVLGMYSGPVLQAWGLRRGETRLDPGPCITFPLSYRAGPVRRFYSGRSGRRQSTTIARLLERLPNTHVYRSHRTWWRCWEADTGGHNAYHALQFSGAPFPIT
jgi:hypothetical protein